MSSDFTPDQKATLEMCWSTVNSLLEFCESIQLRLNEEDTFLARMHADQLKMTQHRLLDSFPELLVWSNNTLTP